MKSKVVLLGPPGCGKGTQAEKLGDELGYVKLSTGDMLREAVRNGTELGMKAKTYMDSGALVPNDLIIGLMKEKIAGLDRIILDGFPRTIEQADALAEQIDIDVAVNIDVDDAELVKRLTQRRSCPDCNAVYHLANKPPAKDGVCDKCGGKLYQRDDDKEETVRNRLPPHRLLREEGQAGHRPRSRQHRRDLRQGPQGPGVMPSGGPRRQVPRENL